MPSCLNLNLLRSDLARPAANALSVADVNCTGMADENCTPLQAGGSVRDPAATDSDVPGPAMDPHALPLTTGPEAIPAVRRAVAT